jgi:dissimilatory sulfite reductase (desulfoviridin) alpha/beta subunit
MEMERNGILPGRIKGKATLRVRSLEPYSAEFTSEQIGVLADIAEQYGSGQAHVTARQTVEIPDVETASIAAVSALLNNTGLYVGSSGSFLRNVMACSRWCLYNVLPVSDLAQRLNKLHADRKLPGKTLISLSGCSFSCTRSRTSDIGVIGRSNIALTENPCIHCTLCVREPLGCQVEAITLTEAGPEIDLKRCVHCGFCTAVCKPATIGIMGTSFDILIGGSGGITPKAGIFWKNVPTEDAVVEEIDRILACYAAVAKPGERTGALLARSGAGFLEEVGHG